MKNAVRPPGQGGPDDENRDDFERAATALQVKSPEAGLPPRGTPKNYLMAWLLVMLKDLNLHGYEIMRTLKDNFAVVSDPGTVYRALRQLERDGYITSWWDPKEQGPARRIYTLTDAGTNALALWSAALEQYRSNLDAFFSLYTGTWVTGSRSKKQDEETTKS